MAKKSGKADWIAVLANVKKKDSSAEGFTTKDVANTFSLSVSKARERIRQALNDGEIIRAGTRNEEAISGRSYPVTVFAVKKKK